MIRFCFRLFIIAAVVSGALLASGGHRAAAQTTPDSALQISWEVKNRFRLFREERDFQLHVESLRNRSVLASEDALELQSDGRGWARNVVNRLCIDLQGRVADPSRCFLQPGHRRELYCRHSMGQSPYSPRRLASEYDGRMGVCGRKRPAVYRRLGRWRLSDIAGRVGYSLDQSVK